MAASIEVKAHEFSRAIQLITESKNFGRNLSEQGLGRIIGSGVVRGFRQNIIGKRDSKGRPWPKIKPRFGTEQGEELRDRGLLFNSFSYRFVSSKVYAGTVMRYAALQNFGGRVFPKPPHKLLAIPLTRAIQRAYQGNFRTLFPDAFVLPAGDTARRKDVLYLVRDLDSGREGRIAKAARAAGGHYRKPGGQILRLNRKRRLEFLARLVPYSDIPKREFLFVSRTTAEAILHALGLKALEKWQGKE